MPSVPATSHETGINEAMAYVVRWRYALAVQADRVEHADMRGFGTLTREADSMFFVVALWRLVASAQLVAKRAPAEIRRPVRAAIEQFHREVPDAKDVRHRLEHFSDYESGTGHEQRRQHVSEPSVTWFEYKPGNFSVTVDVPSLSSVTVEMVRTIEAADRLLVALETAISS